MDNINSHTKEVEQLQLQVRELFNERKLKKNNIPLSLEYGSKSSFITRKKSYKKGCQSLPCGHFNRILMVDREKMILTVEPRVTMEDLVNATLPYSVTIAIVPELKGITVGGAISGIGAEGASHQWGCFNDLCTAIEIITGDGSLIRATPTENSDIFYGFPGSYGSLGILVLAELRLVPAKKFVHLRYHAYSNPHEAIHALKELYQKDKKSDFIDGMIFSKELAVIIEGNFHSEQNSLPLYSTEKLSSEFYFQHVKNVTIHSKEYEELMTTSDYFFRYDLGAFWMGTYLFRPSFFAKFMTQGLFRWNSSTPFTQEEAIYYSKTPFPNALARTFLHPLMKSKNLCKILHKAEEWIENHCIIQDFCIPESNSSYFLDKILEIPGIFPIWLLPIKGTRTPQIFAPHLINDNDDYFINFGVYGIPPSILSMQELVHSLENKANELGGRKVLYSHSYYSSEEFWNIYDFESYSKLRDKMAASGAFRDITDKVLTKTLS